MFFGGVVCRNKTINVHGEPKKIGANSVRLTSVATIRFQCPSTRTRTLIAKSVRKKEPGSAVIEFRSVENSLNEPASIPTGSLNDSFLNELSVTQYPSSETESTGSEVHTP